ncbi:condensin-2 complex subunit D3 [Papilio machaon]|uniref:condensin-2 complex subunit D3 n=1 Tax=Papilio machaon TaxID=76193 RepID=UPI001E665ED9|nr:condensin-2 complex subunit D3 [Papilio machaon]
MNEILNKIELLQLYNLSEDWVKAIFNSEFLEFEELPADYENAFQDFEYQKVCLEIMQSIDSWVNSEPINNEEKSWARLSHEIQHEKLLSLLAYYIDYGNKNVINNESRYNALLASRLYYKLLTIPGYKAYHIYHSQLFVNSLVCLSFPKTLCENEENYLNVRELTREVNDTLKTLQIFANDLSMVIKTLQLKPNNMNFEDILSNLVDITGGAIVKKLNVDKVQLGNLTASIYNMIDILVCDSKGSPYPEAVQVLFKCLLPKLVSASTDSRNSNNVVRASYVTYSALLLSKFGKAALPGYIILLQHLCYTLDGLERAEVRTARMSLVLGLMSLLPKKSYKDFIKWILKLSATSKVSHRQIAVEILSKLLNNDPEESVANENLLENQSRSDADSGIQESSVLTTDLEEVSALSPNTVQNVTNGGIINEDLNSSNQQEQDALLEEELSKVLQARSHTAPHAAIVRALYDRVHDVSSTVRMRALALLTDCVDSTHPPVQHAIKKLNGTSEVTRLAALAGRCVCDERAVVRRAAAALAHRLLAAAHTHTPNELAVLISLCRDASIIVRSTAITALGELVTQMPSDELLDAFLTGPMHQLSDPEAKVQDQVVTQIQQILFERMRAHSAIAKEDPLPWMFLAAIVRKNMRRHLQKACTLLHKASKCINNRLIEIIRSHLGNVSSSRDLQCLALLTSSARHLHCEQLDFLLQYFYKLEDDVQKPDIRIVAMTLEMLTLWSRWLSAEDREALRRHLLQKLAAASTAQDDGCRPDRVNLAAHLDPNNLEWASHLMKIAESRAVCGGAGAVAEYVRAADLALVAPDPPSPDLLHSLLQRIQHPGVGGEVQEVSACVVGAGRVCLRSRASAAAAAPPLAALLRDARAPLPARLNALLALTDICIRYACIVEPLLGSISQCVDIGTAPPLRRAAARALTRLLLAGYLRLRTPLYYRYCALLADEEHDVREPAEYYVSSCLTADHIYHHFVDCLLYYNSDEGGGLSFDARQLIYDVMLQRLSAVQKLNVQCRVAREVLQHAADLCDDSDTLPDTLHAALLDTITLLCGPRMKLPKKPQTTGDTADIDDLTERVTSNIVSYKMKRTVAEVLVPAVLRLYAHMRPRGGQLAAYLVRIATDLLADYRQEIEELIQLDEELVQRIRQFQETIGLEPSFGNARNLVTASAPPDPDTPRAPRKRPAHRHHEPHPQPKRALRI